MRKALVALVVVFVCAAHAAMAGDDGQTQPKLNTASSNSSSTPTDLIASTNGTGNIKGVTCVLNHDGSGNQPTAIVKFYVNGGGAQTVALSGFQGVANSAGYTGWVPYNVRFTSSIQITIQKQTSFGNAVDCAVSWALD
jgi:hypothetical protein